MLLPFLPLNEMRLTVIFTSVNKFHLSLLKLFTYTNLIYLKNATSLEMQIQLLQTNKLVSESRC